MKLRWAPEASDDVLRLHQFLARVDPDAAARIARSLIAAPEKLLDYPRIGEKLEIYPKREVRRLIIGSYEMRYEIKADAVLILRIWHCREDRDIV